MTSDFLLYIFLISQVKYTGTFKVSKLFSFNLGLLELPYLLSKKLFSFVNNNQILPTCLVILDMYKVFYFWGYLLIFTYLLTQLTLCHLHNYQILLSLWLFLYLFSDIIYIKWVLYTSYPPFPFFLIFVFLQYNFSWFIYH